MDITNLKGYEIAKKIKDKEIKAIEVTEAFLERTKKIDNVLGGYLNIYEENAREEAKKIDAKNEKNEDIGILGGVPIAIKDNIAVKDMKMTCASKILENYVSPYDATSTTLLKNSGAIIIGKCNMDEFAMGSSNENSAFKLAKNPYDIDSVPGGSSGGSAVVVSSRQVPISLGSDTGGSVRQPAAYTGTYGLKPTYGAVSRYGLTSFGSTLDQIGIFSRDIKDMAMTFNAISKYDKHDFTSKNKKNEDYLLNIDNSIKGKKIGVPVEYFGEGLDSETRKAIENSIEILKSLGAEICECSLSLSKYALATYYILSSAEASSNLARFDGIRYGYRDLSEDNIKDLYTSSRMNGFGDEVKRRIMLGTYVLSKGYYDEYYKKGLKVRRLIRDEFLKKFEEFDLILSPTTPKSAFKIGAKAGDVLSMYLEDIYTVPVNIAGIPAISIPCGFSNGKPVGLQLMSNFFNESLLFNAANEFDKIYKFNEKSSELYGGEFL